MKKKYLTHLFVWIALSLVLIFPLVKYISYLDVIGYGDNHTFDTMHYYLAYPLILSNFFLLWVHINPEKRERKWQYLAIIVLYFLLMIYLLNTKQYVDGTPRVNEIKYSIKSRFIYMMFMPSFLTLLLSFVLEYRTVSQKYLKTSWIIIFMVMMVYQMSQILKAGAWVSTSVVNYEIFFGNYQTNVLLILSALLVGIAHHLDVSEKKTLLYYFSILSVSLMGIFLLVKVNSILLTIKSMQIEFIICILPTLLAFLFNHFQAFRRKQKEICQMKLKSIG